MPVFSPKTENGKARDSERPLIDPVTAKRSGQ